MALTREKKEEIEKRLTDAITGSQSAVFVNFHGLTTPDANALREALRVRKVRYIVAKKTLLRRALVKASIGGEAPDLAGEVAIAFGEDLVDPAKGVAEFEKTHKESFRILGGVLEKKYRSPDEIAHLATIPSSKELRGQLVGVMHAPVRGFATVLAGTARSFVIVLDQISKHR